MSNEVLLVAETQYLFIEGSKIEVLEIGTQGPPGIQGPVGPAGPLSLSVIAGQALGGHRAVVQDATGAAFYADCTTPTHFGRLAGITSGAAILGSPVSLIRMGVLTEPSWAWAPNAPVFLGLTGLLTQTAPTLGFLQVVGIALSAITLFINPREPLATI